MERGTSVRPKRTGRKSPKRTISVNGGLGLLQMISKPDIEQCASEDVETRRGVDIGWCASENVESRKEKPKEDNICGGWTSGGVLARMLGPERKNLKRTIFVSGSL